jgi:hypothetical protein
MRVHDAIYPTYSGAPLFMQLQTEIVTFLLRRYPLRRPLYSHRYIHSFSSLCWWLVLFLSHRQKRFGLPPVYLHILVNRPLLPRVSPPVSKLILPQFRSQGRLFSSNSVSLLGSISSLLLLILWTSSSTKVAILSCPQRYQVLS